METSPTLTILLVSYNTKALIDPCLAALDKARAHVGPSEVVIVDNASRDGSAEHIEQHHPEVKLIKSTANIGFGRANNLALAEIGPSRLLLLNTDAFVAEDSLASAMAYMDAHPDCGIVGARLVGRDGDIQPSCRYFPTPLNVFLGRTGLARLLPRVRMIDGPQWAPSDTQECDWVPGCFYLIRREVIAEVGLFDPRYFLYYEEVDHCLAARRAGWKVVYLASTTVVHIGGESARSDGEITKSGRQVDRISMESAMLYFRKNKGRLGLWAHILLELLADTYLGMKAIVKRRDLAAASHLRKRIATTFELLRITGLGTRQTR